MIVIIQQKEVKIEVFRVNNGELQYESKVKNNWVGITDNVSTLEVKNAIITLMGPYLSIISVSGTTEETKIELDISWNKPTYSNYLNNEKTSETSNVGYKIELSINSNFIPIYLSHIVGYTSDENISIKLDNTNTTPPLRCTGYYVRISAKNEKGRYGRPEIFKNEDENPKMVSAGDNCYDYETKEKWIALPDYYKKQIETIMFFKSTTIPENSLNQDVFENDLPTPDEGNFTIEISGNVTDISENAFSGLSTLTKVIFNASTTSLKIGHSAFKDCTDLSFVDIHRKWLPNDLSNYDDIFGLSYDTSGTPLTLTYNGEIDSSFSLVDDISASKLFTNRNDTDVSNGVIINLHGNDPFITANSLTSPYYLTNPTIDFNWDNTSPILSMNVTNITINSMKLDAESNENGILYYAVLPTDASPPTPAHLKSQNIPSSILTGSNSIVRWTLGGRGG